MTLDELIKELQEAKEHCVPGKSKVIITIDDTHSIPELYYVEWNNQNVFLNCTYE